MCFLCVGLGSHTVVGPVLMLPLILDYMSLAWLPQSGAWAELRPHWEVQALRQHIFPHALGGLPLLDVWEELQQWEAMARSYLFREAQREGFPHWRWPVLLAAPLPHWELQYLWEVCRPLAASPCENSWSHGTSLVIVSADRIGCRW